MLYVSYRHRRNPGRELIMLDGAAFPEHLRRDDWYVHTTYQMVSGRTEADIATLGYCDRSGAATFGRRVGAPQTGFGMKAAG